MGPFSGGARGRALPWTRDAAVVALRWSCSAVLVGMAALPLACVRRPSPQARKLLVDAYDAYGRSEYERTVALADRFLARSADTTRADEAYRLRGVALYRLARYDAAREDLRRALDRTGREAFRAECLFLLGEIAFRQGELDQAAGLYQRSLDHTGRGKEPSNKAHYRLGRLLQRKGQWVQADKHLDHVAFLFPETDLARRAKQYAGANAWTIQAGAFGARANAEERINRLQSKGLPARLHPALRERGLRYIVQVGRYQTYRQAEQALPAARRHQSDAFVTVTE